MESIIKKLEKNQVINIRYISGGLVAKLYQYFQMNSEMIESDYASPTNTETVYTYFHMNTGKVIRTTFTLDGLTQIAYV